MAIYDWRDFEPIAESGGLDLLANRYESAAGAERVEAWQAFVQDLFGLLERAETEEGRSAIVTLTDRFLGQSKPKPANDTVFVSHQRLDADWAERVAWEASELGLDYWLDIHDLAVPATLAQTLHPLVRTALIAAIIEMALLNCTHIVSLQTMKARASRWVPYELGRAKHRVALATNAASWLESSVKLDPGGDYLALAFFATRDLDLYAWLRTVAKRTGPLHPNTIWRGQHSPPLHKLPN
jgi:hypothetical protein